MVLGFVVAVVILEQIQPAQRRPLLARGHLLDFCYGVFYALLVIPKVPSWCFVALAVRLPPHLLAITAWLQLRRR